MPVALMLDRWGIATCAIRHEGAPNLTTPDSRPVLLIIAGLNGLIARAATVFRKGTDGVQALEGPTVTSRRMQC